MKEKDTFEELQKKKKRKLQNSSERKHEFDNPAKSSPRSGRTSGGKSSKKRNKKKDIAKNIGIVLTALQGIMSVVFVGILLKLNLLPMKFMIPIILVFAALFGITFWTQKRHKKRAIFGKIFACVMIIVLSVGSFYLAKMNSAFGKVTGASYKIDSIVVAVLNEDPAETIADAKDYTFGTQYTIGGEDIKKAVDAINKELEAEIAITEYTNMQEMATALHDGTVQAIIYNEGYTGMLSENFEGYESSVKIIHRYEIKTEVEVEEVKEFSITEDTFSVYLSGIDVYGAIETNSRSDVNIIATVNPQTRQILLTTTPRDYYVTFPGVTNGQKDKLTHAGIYGVDTSIATLESLYETEIPFYARVNFTSLIEIVNVLGGVDVYSEYAFTTNDGTLTVRQGMNHFTGKQALAFARERYNVPGGDNQRGKNQQAVIIAMIKKMISPAILTQASGIIDSVSGNVETNMSQEHIQELIKMQLNEGGSWSIYSVAATGTGDSNITYSMPGLYTYVMNPDQSSVDVIVDLMNRVEEGEIIDGSELAE